MIRASSMVMAASAEGAQQVHCALLMLSALKFVRFTASSGLLRALRRARVRLRYSVVSGMTWPVARDALMACSRPVQHAAAQRQGSDSDRGASPCGALLSRSGRQQRQGVGRTRYLRPDGSRVCQCLRQRSGSAFLVHPAGQFSLVGREQSLVSALPLQQPWRLSVLRLEQARSHPPPQHAHYLVCHWAQSESTLGTSSAKEQSRLAHL